MPKSTFDLTAAEARAVLKEKLRFRLAVIHMSHEGQMIRTGGVAYELLRPLDLYGLWYSRALAWRTAPTVLRAVPMVVLAIPFLGMGWPASWASAAAFLAALVGAVCLASAITTLTAITMLWTVSGEGISRLIPSAVVLLSGMIVPLPLFPQWAQGVLNVLPFRGVVDLPFRLYMGHIDAHRGLFLFAHQIIWTAIIGSIARLLMERALKRIAVQGG